MWAELARAYINCCSISYLTIPRQATHIDAERARVAKPECCPMDALSVLVGVYGKFEVTCCPYTAIGYESVQARLTITNCTRTNYGMQPGDVLIFDAENVPHYGESMKTSALRLHVPYVRVVNMANDRSHLVDEVKSKLAYAAANAHVVVDPFRK